MRTPDIQRDDSVLPFALFVSLLAHSLLLLMMSTPRRSTALTIEHIYPTIISYQAIPEPQLFLAFSPTQKIFTSNREGVTRPTTGNRVAPMDKPTEVKPVDEPARGHIVENPIESVESRKFYGAEAKATVADDPVDAPTPQRRPAPRLSAPSVSPEGVIDEFDPAKRRSLSTPKEAAKKSSPADELIRRNENPSAMKVDRKNDAGTAGVLDVPEKTRIKVTLPQSGQTLDDQIFEPPRSVGNEVSRDPVTPPRPVGQSPPSPADQKGARDRTPIYMPKPAYPEWAERDQVQASVTFELTITAEGRVSRTRLEVSSGYPELDRLAEASVRQWLYEPRPGQSEIRRANVQFVLPRKG